jgi:hypothetical protein
MDTAQLGPREDAFDLYGLTARVHFRSPSSVSFDFGRRSHSQSTFSHVGWIDVHHPCDGHIKAQLRIQVPKAYHGPEQMTSFIRQVFETLSIPSDETYEALFFCGDAAVQIEQATDRDGATDRWYSQVVTLKRSLTDG